MSSIRMPQQISRVDNWVAGALRRGSGPEIAVESPYTGHAIGALRASTAVDVDHAVTAAREAFPAWSRTPLRERIEPLLALRALLLDRLGDLANTVALESGKTPSEARAGILRGVEVIDFAASLQNLDQGGAADVSRGVSCEYRREPLGVVAGITPFNFPAMVPMWMFPLALTAGNAFVLKPSEKVPLTAGLIAELTSRAGYPPGVFSVLHGDRATVEALVDHPVISAVAFVGSTPVARAVYARAGALGKRALCLGGAKNALIVAPDADPALAVKAIVDSFTGCAGQRCMAGSLMVAVGGAERLIEAVKNSAAAISVGTSMGALIDRAARVRLEAAVERARGEGATVLLDGREPKVPSEYEGGHWLGPTLLDHVTPQMECAREELFGPVLSILRVPTLEAALALEQTNPHGNAVSIFTSSGAAARQVAERAGSGMIGINIGVPVPREPFSFGGTRQSRFGHGDITGQPGLDFWTDLKKITTKWAPQSDATWMS